MWSVLKRDLGEFVSTLQDDVAVIKSAISLGGDDYAEESYSSEEEEEFGDRHPPVSATFRALRADVKTYSEDVSEAEKDSFLSFMRTFDIGSKTEEIAALLKEDPAVATIHTRLVPEHVSYDEFWCRFFFRSRRLGKGRPVGISFPQDDEDDDDFGWGDDDQEEGESPFANTDDDDDDPSAAPDGPLTPRGGEGKGKRGDESKASAAEPGVDASIGRADPPAAVEVVGSGSAGGVMRTLASAAAAAEIARLTEALRVSEIERKALVASGSGGAANVRGVVLEDGSRTETAEIVQKLMQEKNSAVAEVDLLITRLRGAEEAGRDAEQVPGAAPTPAIDQNSADVGRLQQLQEALDSSEARAATIEEKLAVESAARVRAEEGCAGAEVGDGAGPAGKGDEVIKKEVSQLKQALREERSKHESMLLASRQAAREAVEEAMSLADADREEACAELVLKMAAQASEKDEVTKALRMELSEATVKVASLEAELADVRRALEKEKEAGAAAAIEVEQKKDIAEQLREEIRVLQAAASRPRACSSGKAVAAARGGASAVGTPQRSESTAELDAGEEPEDRWGDEESDSCCAASTNTQSSGVLVEAPQAATAAAASSATNLKETEKEDDEGQKEGGQRESVVSASSLEGVVAELGEGGDQGEEVKGVSRGDTADREKEGDDEWEGWD